ncbi:alpha/beta hydrolase [Crossiella cryophila]|uniref:Pimeloyl-ACP methyl ester carboxylesterase n=1 Tax=Crossiella cryophila TaxID=43355 RepID=A0A7W7C9J9_9PSEU|nr:alpha/beta hydrolase [Crossiella cryophila]MBB4677010.1 pimeloyl-ACP methyl ester carboxylesterase [Crossiella cryophila]
MTTESPTLVLVHGAWHGAWTWDELIPLLGEWPVVAVELPTLGDPAAGLAEDAAAVRAAVTAVDGPVVVVAHSYGGVVVTEALAGLPNVAHILYLAAFVLDVGDSLVAAAGGDGSPPWWEVGEDGLVRVTGAAEVFYNDLPAERAQAAVARLRPQALRPFLDELTAAAWREVPTSYLVTTEDNAIPAFVQRQFARRCGSVSELGASHSPFLSRPDQVAELIRQIAK